MDIFKIMGVAFVGTLLALLVKQQRPEIAIQISLATGIIILLFVAQSIGGLFEGLNTMAQRVGIDIGYIGVIIKIIGITYITEFASALCKDAGEEAIAVKLELAGKVIILILALPLLSALLTLIMEILP